jgi:hypothetical protein
MIGDTVRVSATSPSGAAMVSAPASKATFVSVTVRRCAMSGRSRATGRRAGPFQPSDNALAVKEGPFFGQPLTLTFEHLPNPRHVVGARR